MSDLAHGGLFVFERLIYLEEVHHFLENVLGQLVDVVIGVVGGILEGDGDDLLVEGAAVDHLDDPDGIAVHEGHGIDGLVAEDEDVQGVAVVCERARDEPVVGGIDRGGIEHAVEL